MCPGRSDPGSPGTRDREERIVLSCSRRIRSLLSLVAVVLTSGALAGALAGGFRIDESGARPRKFRISALRRGSETHLTPSILRRTLLDRTGRSIRDTPGQLRVGEQDGQRFLLIEREAGSESFLVIGDASDLDAMRLHEGVVFTGKEVWDTGARVWRTRSNRSEWPELPVFEGELLDREWARDRLFESLATGEGFTGGNLEVVASVLTQSWRDLLRDPNGGSGSGSAEEYLTRVRDFYQAPLRQVFDGADVRGRKRLLRFHKAMTKSASARARKLRKQGRPEIFQQVFDQVLVELRSLREELQSTPRPQAPAQDE